MAYLGRTCFPGDPVVVCMLRIRERIARFPFLTFWLLTSLLYLPAWKAGFVTDAIDRLYEARHLPFFGFLSSTEGSLHSVGLTTRVVTYLMYQGFGAERLPWFLLFVTMQAGVAALLFTLCFHVFGATGIKRRRAVALWAGIAFCASPYLPEVLVWKACYHYLEALLLMFGVLVCVERFIYTRNPKFSWLAAGLFLLSAFSLELFLLTPLLTASLLFFYKRLGWELAARPKTWRIFLLPQAWMIGLHFLITRLWTGTWLEVGFATDGSFQAIADYLGKLAISCFHLLLFGRYWPDNIRQVVYHWCMQPIVGYLIFLALVALLVHLVRRAAGGFAREQTGLLLLFWTVLSALPLLLLPLESKMSLLGSRYLYLPVAFLAVLLAVAVNTIPRVWLRATIGACWMSACVLLTFQETKRWRVSEQINEDLLSQYISDNQFATILLSAPCCYQGIPMIQASEIGNFERAHQVLQAKAGRNRIYDAMAFSMNQAGDGSRVTRINDSTLRVSLLQAGSKWWYGGGAGKSYETPDYRIAMGDPAGWYDIVFRKPMMNYRLLYQSGRSWKRVGR